MGKDLKVGAGQKLFYVLGAEERSSALNAEKKATVKATARTVQGVSVAMDNRLEPCPRFGRNVFDWKVIENWADHQYIVNCVTRNPSTRKTTMPAGL